MVQIIRRLHWRHLSVMYKSDWELSFDNWIGLGRATSRHGWAGLDWVGWVVLGMTGMSRDWLGWAGLG